MPNAEWRTDRRVVDLLSTLQSPRVDFAQPQARFRRRGFPLHEPDDFIDVRKLLAKSASPSRRHWSTSAPASLVDVPPQAFDGGDRPPSLRKERTHKHSPQRYGIHGFCLALAIA